MNIDVAFSVVHALAGHFAGSTAYAPVNVYIDAHQLQSLRETLQAATLNSGIFASWSLASVVRKLVPG